MSFQIACHTEMLSNISTKENSFQVSQNQAKQNEGS